MSRPSPLAARLLACLAACLALASSGCISPAKIAAVEDDATLGQLLPRAVETAAPLPAAQDSPDKDNPAAEPLRIAARPLVDLPAAEMTVAVQPREALPPPAPSQQPPQAATEALAQPAGPRRVKSIQEISLDITPQAGGQDDPSQIKPPMNEGAAALVALAGEQPFTRGSEIDYGYDVVPAVGGLEMCYQPLYFQELNAERYGRSWGILQPAVSVANFYGRIPLLPYMAVSRPARRCTNHAHWALPGYRIPGREPHPLVISPAGGAAQTAALFGLILLIP
jgi:hypothetical protein